MLFGKCCRMATKQKVMTIQTTGDSDKQALNETCPPDRWQAWTNGKRILATKWPTCGCKWRGPTPGDSGFLPARSKTCLEPCQTLHGWTFKFEMDPRLEHFWKELLLGFSNEFDVIICNWYCNYVIDLWCLCCFSHVFEEPCLQTVVQSCGASFSCTCK